jgi:hypothetical protein
LLKRMLRTPVRLALPLCLMAATPVASLAQQAGRPIGEPVGEVLQPQVTGQREHVVRRGDTLWDLARAYLNNPFLWPTIFEANRNVVQNPHWIYPAERLIIPGLLQRAEPSQPITQLQLPPLEYPAAAQDTAAMVLTTLEMRRAVMSAGEYLRLPWLSQAANAGATGRIARAADAVADDDRIASALYPNDHVYMTFTGRQPLVGDSVMVIRPGRRIGDWGTIVEPAALLRVDSVIGGAVLAQIVNQFGEVRVGDTVMPLVNVPEFGFGAAEPVEGGPEGQILQFLFDKAMYGTTDLAFISLGRNRGVGIGDEFAVYVPGGNGLPPRQVAELRAVHVGDRTSTVRVISVNSTALRDGLAVRKVRSLP